MSCSLAELDSTTLGCDANTISRWKHAAGCHAGSILEGEGDIFEDDNVLEKLVSLEG